VGITLTFITCFTYAAGLLIRTGEISWLSLCTYYTRGALVAEIEHIVVYLCPIAAILSLVLFCFRLAKRFCTPMCTGISSLPSFTSVEDFYSEFIRIADRWVPIIHLGWRGWKWPLYTICKLYRCFPRYVMQWLL